MAEHSNDAQDFFNNFRFVPDEHGGHFLSIPTGDKWYPESHTENQVRCWSLALQSLGCREGALMTQDVRHWTVIVGGSNNGCINAESDKSDVLARWPNAVFEESKPFHCGHAQVFKAPTQDAKPLNAPRYWCDDQAGMSRDDEHGGRVQVRDYEAALEAIKKLKATIDQLTTNHCRSCCYLQSPCSEHDGHAERERFRKERG